MICKIKQLLKKYETIILYLIFGVLTTVVNIILYYIFNDLLELQILEGYNYLVASVIAWVGAVLFAYITNKLYVFKKKSKEKIFREIISFITFRLLTLVFDLIIMYVLVDMIKVDDLISKVVANIVVIVLNYVFSKIFIFKK